MNPNVGTVDRAARILIGVALIALDLDACDRPVGLDRRRAAGDGRIPLLPGLSPVWIQHMPEEFTLMMHETIENSAPAGYRELTQGVSKNLATLRADLPEVMKGFSDLARAATQDGALDKKTKELIALALGVAARCDACIGFHAQTLVKLGATKLEVEEMLGMAVYMGGGPSLMYAANALAAFEEFSSR